MSTGVIILAAGGSSRMGQPKQLLHYHGKTLLHGAVDTALAVSTGVKVVVVLGSDAKIMSREAEGLLVQIVVNEEWHEGMGASLRCGLHALLESHPQITSVIFMLCDQPLLTPHHLQTLLTAREQSGSAIVASQYDNTLGVPALFDRSLFPELLALGGNEGARHVIQRHRAEVTVVPFPEGEIDIDLPEDYARLYTMSTPMTQAAV